MRNLNVPLRIDANNISHCDDEGKMRKLIQIQTDCDMYTSLFVNYPDFPPPRSSTLQNVYFLMTQHYGQTTPPDKKL